MNVRRPLYDTTHTKDSRPLDARTATIVFVIYLVCQVLFSAVLILLRPVVTFVIGISGRQSITAFTALPLFNEFVDVLGGIVCLLMASSLLSREILRDRSPVGSACAKGEPIGILAGFISGLTLAGSFVVFRLVNLGPSHGAFGGSQFVDTFQLAVLDSIMTIVLIPVTEEILFRGILYGGYRKSFGALGAGVLTTILFVGLHLPRSLETTIGITLLALLCLYCRLRFRAIGAAIAVHAGYNLCVTIFNILEYGHQ